MGDDTEKDTLTLTSVRKNIWQNFLRKFMTYDDSGVRILTDKRNEEPIDNIWSISRSMVDQIEEEIKQVAWVSTKELEARSAKLFEKFISSLAKS